MTCNRIHCKLIVTDH